MKSVVIWIPIVALVSACAGGTYGPPPEPEQFGELAGEKLRLTSQFSSAQATQANAMPRGTATYNGVASFSKDLTDHIAIVASPQINARALITANFEQSTISGNLTGFREYELGFGTGTVAISSSQISGSNVTATMAGDVTFPLKQDVFDNEIGFPSGPGAFILVFDGTFKGATAQGLYGGLSGTYRDEPIYGVLAAER